jgi:bile acid:Na+ symporter, BASS family
MAMLQRLVMLGLQTSIILTVFGFGLQATLGDVLYLGRRPSLLARSLLAMFVVMPIVAVLMVRTFDLRPSVEIALVALALSPVPPLSPGTERKAGGQTSYALGLMAIVSLLTIVSVPLGVRLVGRYFGQPFLMPAGAIAQVAVKMALLPLMAGLVVRALMPAVANRVEKPFAAVAKVLLLAGALALLAAALPAALSLIGGGTILAIAGFVAVGLGVGHALGGPAADERMVLALSTASRHPVIALTIAKVNFPNEPYLGATIVLYLLVGAVVGVPYRLAVRRATSRAAH